MSLCNLTNITDILFIFRHFCWTTTIIAVFATFDTQYNDK